jgi:hypothetical protein
MLLTTDIRSICAIRGSKSSRRLGKARRIQRMLRSGWYWIFEAWLKRSIHVGLGHSGGIKSLVNRFRVFASGVPRVASFRWECLSDPGYARSTKIRRKPGGKMGNLVICPLFA